MFSSFSSKERSTGGAGVGEGADRSLPHLSQKVLSCSQVLPQDGHLNSNSVLHFLQNLASSLFSVWQFGHFILHANQAVYEEYLLAYVISDIPLDKGMVSGSLKP